MPDLSLALERPVLGSSIRLTCLVLTAATVTAVSCVSARAMPSIQNCGSLSIGPGGTERVAGAGARCLLQAYQQDCRPAVYVLSLSGIDTLAVDSFRLTRGSGKCLVEVTISSRVVPQPARQHHGVCRTLVLRSRHVVAGRCTGESIPPTIVLDPRD